MVEEIKSDESAVETLRVKVEDARLKRDEESGQPALQWQLRKADGKIIWHKQVLTPDAMPEIKKNLAMCNIVCSNEELPSQLIKAKGCEIEIQREGKKLSFTQKAGENIFTGILEEQKVAEEIPL